MTIHAPSFVRVGALAPAVALAGCGSSAPKQTEWPYTSTDGGFKVVFPNRFDTFTSKAGEGTAARSVTSSMASKGSDQFGVTYSDFPSSFLAGGAAAVLETARDQVVAGIKGTVVSSDASTFGEHPALDVVAIGTASAVKGEYHAKFVLVGTRIYEVLVIRNDTKASDEHMLDFFDSFELTGS